MRPKTRVLLTVIAPGCIDSIIPIPIVACLLISVVLQRPTWCTDRVRDIDGPWHRENALSAETELGKSRIWQL